MFIISQYHFYLPQPLAKEFLFVYRGDLASVDSIESFFDKVKQQHTGVDILINNAGIQHVSPVDSFSTTEWDRIMAINLSGVFHTSRLCLPHMKMNNWGRIINISSVHGMYVHTT
jgi:3-hydroxybutyrate dehydrogenase